MAITLLTLCLALAADEPIAPEKSAVIEREQQKAQAEVNAKYGNKKASELSREEQGQRAKDLANAEKAVLEKNGLDAKQWARESLKKDREAYAQQKQAVKELEEKEKAAEAKKKADADAPKEIEVQRGVSEENPVTLDEKPNTDGTVSVEKGLPPEATQELQGLQGTEGAGAAEEAPRPPPKPSGKRSRRR